MSEHRPTLSRRRLLAAAGAAGVGATGFGAGVAATAQDDTSDGVRSTPGFVAFEGVHQSGVVTPRPDHGLVAAFDITAPDRSSLIELLRSLSATTRDVMAGRRREERDPLVPPDDNLILSPNIEPDALTVTMAVGATLFDQRYGLVARPRSLIEMPAFPNDDLQVDSTHGDLVLQICANRDDTCAHALRRLMRTGTRYLSLRWMVAGFARQNELPAGRTSTRNLLGFKDGTANLDATDSSLMDDFVWVQANDGEPRWATGGTYMAVRVIRTRVEFWDRTALRTQELVIGRSKHTGAPLDGTAEDDTPGFGADPDGRVTPVNAHIRLANPRTEGSASSSILRRGFNFSRGFTASGQLDQGLLFVCFQRDLSKGFMAVQQRLNGEALEEYVTPTGGGFYFVLPGVTRADGWLGEGLFE